MNTKYGHIKNHVDTGKTMKQVSTVSDQLLAKRKNEKFKRVKCSTLARLVRESGDNNVESIYDLNKGGGGPDGMDSVSVVAGKSGLVMQEESKGGHVDTESMHSMMTGVTQASAVTYATEMLGITSETSFLLLDLREPEEYNIWHIKEAINYPAPNIGRDKIIPELYLFKNKLNKLIIVYMNDERAGTKAAMLLAEKGYENTFLLSGGIE